mmetsp:Transcript_7785/g.22282  ORF Transcript_7785/g.22282 Transcript_7785/m.22282 type:complete len:215 (+) Transcript_7785:1578-2222(+)
MCQRRMPRSSPARKEPFAPKTTVLTMSESTCSRPPFARSRAPCNTDNCWNPGSGCRSPHHWWLTKKETSSWSGRTSVSSPLASNVWCGTASVMLWNSTTGSTYMGNHMSLARDIMVTLESLRFTARPSTVSPLPPDRSLKRGEEREGCEDGPSSSHSPSLGSGRRRCREPQHPGPPMPARVGGPCERARRRGKSRAPSAQSGPCTRATAKEGPE